MLVLSIKRWSVRMVVGMLLVGSLLSAGVMPAKAATTGELELLYKQLELLSAQLKLMHPTPAVLGVRNVVVRNNTELAQAIMTVQGGDVIQLAPGNYGTLVMVGGQYNQLVVNGVKYSGKTPSPTTAVTLTSLERSNPALFQRMVIGTSNWVVDGLAFETPPAVENRGMVFVSDGADDVTIKNSTFMVRQSGDSSHWTKEEWQSLTGSVRLLVGINTAGKDTIIENNYIKNIQYAITAAEESSGAIIRRNTVDGFTIDGVRALGDQTLVEANLIKNSVQLSTTHNDCVQSWSRSAAGLVGGGEVIGLVIRGNLCISNEDPDHAFPGQIQGVGFFDGMFRDTLIEENIILSDVYHGIALYGGIDSIVRNNTVLDMKTGRPGPIWIRTNNHKNGTPSRNVVMEKNITNAVYGATSTVIARDNYLVKVEEYGSVFRDIANFDATIIGSLVPSGVGATPRPVGSTLSVPQLTNGLVVLPPPATTTPPTVPTDPAPVRPTPATTTTPTPVPVPTATTTPTEPVADVPAVTISGIRANQVVTGGMTVEARPTDFIRVRTVQFIIDGVVITTESSRPYSLAGDGGIGKLYAYNTTALRNGQHTLRVVVTGSESQTATAEVVFTVQNVGTTTPTVLVPTPTVVTVPVKTTDVVNVRNSTNQILGTQPVGAVGAKNSAATYTMNDTVYVQVTFATGVSGYVASQYLSSTVTTPIVPNADIQAQITSLLQQVMALQALLAELLRTR